MTERNDYPAFPVTAGNNVFATGMTLRDWFAGQALAGWMASFTPDCSVNAAGCANMAYELADAMLEARK